MSPAHRPTRTSLRPAVCLAALPLLLPGAARGAAWPMAPGAGQATVSASFLAAGSVTDADGEKRGYGMTEAGLSTYGEVGLLPRLSLGWAWGAVKAVWSDSADAVGTTDPELSLAWHLGRKGSWVFALQALAQAPLGPENPSRVPGFAPAFFSHRAFGLEARPLVGWAGGGWWSQGGLGLKARTGDLSGQFRYTAAAGRAFGKRLSGLLSFDGVFPLDGEPAGKPGDQERYYGYHLALESRLARDWRAGAQFDSMLDLGQEMPLGARFNLYFRRGWR